VHLNGDTLAFMLRGERVVVAGLVSAKEDAESRVSEASARVMREGGEIVGVVIQRRGVSRAGRPGGVRRMSDALDRTTFIGPGKARELAETCAARRATVVLFLNALEPRQRDALAAMTGARVVDH
jgi:50S ribosomal subunit-associated GTPase HflX